MKVKNIYKEDMAFGNTLLKVGEAKDLSIPSELVDALVRRKKLEIVDDKAVKAPSEKPKSKNTGIPGKKEVKEDGKDVI